MADLALAPTWECESCRVRVRRVVAADDVDVEYIHVDGQVMGDDSGLDSKGKWRDAHLAWPA